MITEPAIRQQTITWTNIDFRQTSNIRRILVGNQIVDHSDLFGTSPVSTGLGRLQQLQCISTGVTTVLHKAIEIILNDLDEIDLCQTM